LKTKPSILFFLLLLSVAVLVLVLVLVLERTLMREPNFDHEKLDRKRCSIE